MWWLKWPNWSLQERRKSRNFKHPNSQRKAPSSTSSISRLRWNEAEGLREMMVFVEVKLALQSKKRSKWENFVEFLKIHGILLLTCLDESTAVVPHPRLFGLSLPGWRRRQEESSSISNGKGFHHSSKGSSINRHSAPPKALLHCGRNYWPQAKSVLRLENKLWGFLWSR